MLAPALTSLEGSDAGLSVGQPSREGLRIVFSSADFEQLRTAVQAGEGDATYLLQSYVANGLAARGHQLTFLAGGALCETIKTADIASAAPAPIGWTGSLPFDIARRAAWRLQELVGLPYLNVFSNTRLCDAAMRCLPSHDLVYERNALYRNGVAMACRRSGVPLVLFVEADEIMEHDYMGVPIKGLLRRRAEQAFRYNLNSASRIVCVSEALRRGLIERWNVAPERIDVFPNAVDVARFRPDASARSAVRAALGLGDRPLVLFVGSFYSWHDVGSLLRAFALTLEKRPEAALVLVGDGDRRQSMEHLAAELGLADSVRFVGKVPHEEVPRYIAAADVSVAPYVVTDEEMWMSPLKVYESLACGASVVASAVGQVTQIIRDGENGLLTEPEDAVGLCCAICDLLDDPAKRARMGDAARRQVVATQSWERYLANLEYLCQAVISEHSAEKAKLA